jgi:hypothetical protein
MIASVYDLGTIRSQRSSATYTETCCRTQMVQDGLALVVAATSFWVECAVAVASSQASLLLCLSSPE